MAKKYARSQDGKIHLVSAVFAEYTICGDAFEGYSDSKVDFSDGNPSMWESVRGGPVTCERCAAQIENCKGVKVRLRDET